MCPHEEEIPPGGGGDAPQGGTPETQEEKIQEDETQDE